MNVIKILLSTSLCFGVFSFGISNTKTANINNHEENETILEQSPFDTTVSVEWKDSGFSNVIMTYRSSLLRISDNTPTFEMNMTIDSTQEKVYFERIGDIGYFYINEILISTVEYNDMTSDNVSRAVTVPNSIRNLGFSAGSGFSNYYYSGQNDWIARAIQSMVQDKAISFLITTLCGGMPAYVVGFANSAYSSASLLWSIANSKDLFSDGNLRGVSIIYTSYNSQCTILTYRATKTYLLKKAWSNEIDTTTGKDFYQSSKHSWISTPYDYTQPAVCRTLLSKYPY